MIGNVRIRKRMRIKDSERTSRMDPQCLGSPGSARRSRLDRPMRAIRLAWLATLFVALASSVRAQDRVEIKGEGVPAKGEIQSVSPTEIVIKVGNNDRTIEVRKVTRFTLAGEPQELTQARRLIGESRYEDALKALGKIDIAKIERDLIKQEIAYHAALATARLALAGGDKKAAEQQLLKFIVGTNQKTPHFFEAGEILGQLAVAQADYKNAEKYFNSITKAPWPEYKMKASVLTGRALQAQARWDDAMKSFETVLAESLDDAAAQEFKLQATVGKAHCLGELDKPADGLKLLESLIQSSDPQQKPELFARAYNAQGACYRRNSQPKDALLAYLHTHLLFNRDAETHAEALYYLTDLWNQVNKPDRAVTTSGLLKSRYAGSPWARK